MAIDTTYQKLPTETPEQYNTRIALYNAQKGGLPSLPQGGGAAPSEQPTLPSTDTQQTPILSFASSLDAAVNLARRDRNASALALMQPLQGTVAASDFNSILGNLNAASDKTAQDLIKRIVPDKLDTSVVEVGGRKLLVNNQTGETVKDLGKASVGGTGTGSSNIITDNERALFTQFRGEPIVKDYNTMLQKKLSVEGILQSGVGGPGDLALVYEFMKALDPTSVVRETEYDSAAKSGNIFAGTLARYNGYLKESGGFLPPQVQQAFLSIINSKFQVQSKLYDNVAKEYERIAKSQGLNPANVVIGYDQPAKTYAPGTIIENGGKQYIVGADGEELTPYSPDVSWSVLKLNK